MDEISLTSLERLRADFDVFAVPGPADTEDIGSDRFDAELIRRGIYSPLPVMGEYLVWGFRLIGLFRAAGVAGVRTVRLPEDPTGAIAAALKLEDRRDGYSWREKEGIAQLVERFGLSGPEKSRIEGLVQSKGSFLIMIEQYRALPVELKRMVDADRMDVKTAWTVRDLPEEALIRLGALSSDMSFSRRRELFVMAREVVMRDSLGENGISSLLRRLEESGDPTEAVRKERFPGLESLEDSFAVFRERVLSGSGIEVRPPKYFEGSRFSVSFSFESDRQLDRILEKLHTVRENTYELSRLLYGPLRSDIPD